MKICSFFFAFFLILMLCCYQSTSQLYPTANLSTSWTFPNQITGQAILSRETNVARFTCGFSFDIFSRSYLFAISIFPTRVRNVGDTVVWSANRGYLVQRDATLNFTAAGDLVLKDGDGSIVWTTNTAGKSVVGMNLTDTGNLVLFDHQNSVVWQSFDHPTDCLLTGQKLFTDQKLKSGVSSTNSSDGMYSLRFTDKGLFGYVESNPPQAYYAMYIYNNITTKGRRYIRFLNGSLALFIHSSEPSHPDVGFDIPKSSSAQYMRLMPDGNLKVFGWQSDSEEWAEVKDFTKGLVNGRCGYPLLCGRNSICSINQQCSCPKSDYFRLVNDRQPNLGCSAITPLTCNSTQDQHLITLENVTYFTSTADMEAVNMETCKQACLNSCSCKAAFFQYDSNASNGECFLPSELFTMSQLVTVSELLTMSEPFNIRTNTDYNASAFIKVQNASHQGAKVVGSTKHASRQVARVVSSAIGSLVLLLVVATGSITYVVHKRKRDAEIGEELLDHVPGMPTRFSYEELKTATENFSKKLGEGGFGAVFEGSLKDGSKIAVVCLEGLSHIKKSFLAEVQSIGSIHHVNLVRLRGFCTWKSQRFLVYDLMSNGSLDKWIYHGVREKILEWECRTKIILDIAKGLAYLHEDCRHTIMHLDIKPQNILLDNDFNAKVSDFGLSKLIDKTQTEVMTTIKGTPGYIAPEWWSSNITEKVDVYSFGIVLLEILCGRKIFDRSQPEEIWHLLSVFQKCWEQGTLLDMVDRYSEDMQTNGTEVVEMMKLASWCLQTDYTRRPSMSAVVKVLEGGMDIESNLDYNFTDPRLQKNKSQEKDLTPLLASVLSGPR